MNFSLKKENILRWSFFLFLIWIPFGTKKFIYAFGWPVSELNSIFVYGSDVLLILFLALAGSYYLRFKGAGIIFRKRESVLLLVFWVLAFLSLVFAANKIFGLYAFVHLSLGILLAFALAYCLDSNLFRVQEIFLGLGLSALFQAVVAFGQFLLQHSLGLSLLGESLASPFTRGVSEIFVAGGRIMRAYGTMPHANILAAFLGLGLISFYYFYFGAKNGLERLASVVAVFFVGLALVFSFSRGGWITALAATGFLLFLLFLQKNYQSRVFALAVILGVALILFLFLMGWAILPRSHLVIDASINVRLIYDRMALAILANNPLGVGIGNDLIFSIGHNLFQAYGLPAKIDWQPIHNLYLLIAVETGLAGLVVFVLLIASLLAKSLRAAKNNLAIVVASALFVALLINAFGDHFLWDLQNGRLMLWLVIGILLGVNDQNHSGKTKIIN